jgi:hypothetical protein
MTDGDLELTFRAGSVFVSTIDQGTTAVVFVGAGDMKFQPSLERELSQVRIFSGADAIVTAFDALYLRFHPTSFDTLLSASELVPVEVDRDEFRRADRVFREQTPKSFGLDLGDLSRDHWSPLPERGDLVAEISTRRFDTLTYSRSSALREDVNLFDRRRNKTIAVYSSVEEHGGLQEPGTGAVFDVTRYDIDVSVDPSRRWLEGRVRMNLRVQGPAVSTLAMRLAEPLVIRSVISEQYGRLFTMRAKGQDTVMIGLPATLTRGAQLSVTVTYAGRLDPQAISTEATAAGPPQSQNESLDLIRQPEPSFLYSNQVNWYPRPAASHYALATLRITVPADLGCVASGIPDPQATVAIPPTATVPARTTFVFHARQPLRYFAFAVSRLEQTEQVAVRFPSPAAALAEQLDTSDPALNLTVIANPGHRRAGRAVAERAADIARYYHSLVGDLPYPNLTVALVESLTPGGHSPGYFAVLNWPATPTSFFQRRNDPASFDRFPDFYLAHEIAHQWWGQAVGWRNYHEQWLSEGFAQYFAAMYAAQTSGSDPPGDELFRDVIRQMRRWAFEMSDQGPISLGSRLGHLQSDSRIFRALVYNKGALVLHMLRQLVGDDVFFRGLRRFYQNSRFQSVGTLDFQVAMESESERPLTDFFDRWIYGSKLPRLAFSYHVESGEAVLTVRQAGDVFVLPVTVTLRYADGTSADVIVPVTDAVASLRVPLAGPLRSAEISRDEPPLAEITRN